MAEKKLPIDLRITDDVEKTVEAKKMEIIKSLLNKPSEGDPITEMVRMNMLERLMRDFESKTDMDEKILSKALTFSLIQQALQTSKPQQDNTALLLMLMQNHGNNKNNNDEFLKFMQLYLQQQQQMYMQQMQMQQQLFSMLFNKQQEDFNLKLEEIAKRSEELIRELNYRIDLLQSSKAVEEQPSLKKYVQELKQAKEVLEELRNELGLGEKPPEITDDRGKIQAGKLLERGIRLVEKLLEKMPARPPAPTPVQEIPMPPVPQQPSQAIEQPIEQPEPVQEQKLGELEQKLQEIEQEAEISFNIPEPSNQEINISEANITQEHNINYGGVEPNENAETVVEAAGEQEAPSEVTETGAEATENAGHNSGNSEE